MAHSVIFYSHRSHFGSRYPIWLKRLASLPFLDPGSNPGGPLFKILHETPQTPSRDHLFFSTIVDRTHRPEEDPYSWN